MVHRRKISTTEVRGNKRFFYTQSGVGFWFRPLFGKMIAAPPGWSTFREKTFIWVNSVIIHSLKNMFKVPGGIRWQFFPVQMRSVFGKLSFEMNLKSSISKSWCLTTSPLRLKTFVYIWYQNNIVLHNCTPMHSTVDTDKNVLKISNNKTEKTFSLKRLLNYLFFLRVDR